MTIIILFAGQQAQGFVLGRKRLWNKPRYPSRAPPLATAWATCFHAALFVLGFSLVFVMGWGGAAISTYLFAVLAGLISFLSPCVLPLVPAYVGYHSGQTIYSALKHSEK